MNTKKPLVCGPNLGPLNNPQKGEVVLIRGLESVEFRVLGLRLSGFRSSGDVLTWLTSEPLQKVKLLALLLWFI